MSLRLPRTSLIDSLTEMLEEKILSEESIEGDRLPPESQLANRYGVSRPIVREALSRLRERGLIETRNGTGTFIRKPNIDHIAEAFVRQIRIDATDEHVDALYQARSLIEVETTRLAAKKVKPKTLKPIELQLKAMKAAEDPEAWAAADLAFHLSIADATGNPYFRTLLMPLATAILAGMNESLRAPASRDVGLAAHENIMKALKNHDDESATELMRLHLADSQQRYLKIFREHL